LFAAELMPIDLEKINQCGKANKAKFMAAGVRNTMALLSVYIYECGEDRDVFAAWLLDIGIGQTDDGQGNKTPGEGMRNEKYAALIHAWATLNQTKIAAMKAAFN